MALVTVNRVSQKVAATGTGAVALAATAQTGFRTLAAAGVADASTLYYTIEDGVAWECGLATYTAGTNTIARTVLISSAGNAAINLSLNAVFSATLLAEGLAQYLTPSALTPYATTAAVAATYAPLASPALTGNPTVPTQTANDNSTKAASTAYVDRAAGGGGGAPSAIINGANGVTVTAALADKGKMYVLAGTGVLSLPAAVQVTGWYAYIKKNDKIISSWSLSPVQTSGAPLIEGLNTLSVYQEEFVLFWDGTGFRTANRPKGWVDIGAITVASVVAALLFTVGFGDVEMGDAMLVCDGITFSTSDVAALRVQKNGAIVTSGYNGASLVWSGSSTGNSALTGGVLLGNAGGAPAAGSPASFDVIVQNINGVLQSAHGRGVVPLPGGAVSEYLIPGNTPVQGLQILANSASSINGGFVSQRMFRR